MRLRRPDALVRWQYLRELRREYDTPVIVCSLGKTGTTALAASIEASGRQALHCHRFGPGPKGPGAPVGRRPFTAWRGEYAAELLGSGRWQIVCAVRDPIARLASSIMEVRRGGTVDDLRAEMVATIEDGRGGLDWFDHLKRATGLDVYASPFDQEGGWQVYESERGPVLVVRFEDLPSAGPVGLARLLGRPVDLVQRNDTAGKAHADVYRAFRAEPNLPAHVLDAAYESPLARHFYSPVEITGFRERWG